MKCVWVDIPRIICLSAKQKVKSYSEKNQMKPFKHLKTARSIEPPKKSISSLLVNKTWPSPVENILWNFALIFHPKKQIFALIFPPKTYSCPVLSPCTWNKKWHECNVPKNIKTCREWGYKSKSKNIFLTQGRQKLQKTQKRENKLFFIFYGWYSGIFSVFSTVTLW